MLSGICNAAYESGECLFLLDYIMGIRYIVLLIIFLINQWYV